MVGRITAETVMAAAVTAATVTAETVTTASVTTKTVTAEIRQKPGHWKSRELRPNDTGNDLLQEAVLRIDSILYQTNKQQNLRTIKRQEPRSVNARRWWIRSPKPC